MREKYFIECTEALAAIPFITYGEYIFFKTSFAAKTKYFFKNTSCSRLFFKVVSYCIWRGELRLVIHFINWVLLEDQVEPFILSCGVIFSMEQLQPSIPSRVIWNKVFKSGLSKFCAKQPLKNLKGYVMMICRAEGGYDNMRDTKIEECWQNDEKQ